MFNDTIASTIFNSHLMPRYQSRNDELPDQLISLNSIKEVKVVSKYEHHKKHGSLAHLNNPKAIQLSNSLNQNDFNQRERLYFPQFHNLKLDPIIAPEKSQFNSEFQDNNYNFCKKKVDKKNGQFLIKNIPHEGQIKIDSYDHQFTKKTNNIFKKLQPPTTLSNSPRPRQRTSEYQDSYPEAALVVQPMTLNKNQSQFVIPALSNMYSLSETFDQSVQTQRYLPKLELYKSLAPIELASDQQEHTIIPISTNQAVLKRYQQFRFSLIKKKLLRQFDQISSNTSTQKLILPKISDVIRTQDVIQNKSRSGGIERAQNTADIKPKKKFLIQEKQKAQLNSNFQDKNSNLVSATRKRRYHMLEVVNPVKLNSHFGQVKQSRPTMMSDRAKSNSQMSNENYSVEFLAQAEVMFNKALLSPYF